MLRLDAWFGKRKVMLYFPQFQIQLHKHLVLCEMKWKASSWLLQDHVSQLLELWLVDMKSHPLTQWAAVTMNLWDTMAPPQYSFSPNWMPTVQGYEPALVSLPFTILPCLWEVPQSETGKTKVMIKVLTLSFSDLERRGSNRPSSKIWLRLLQLYGCDATY